MNLLSLNLARDLNPSIGQVGWNLAIASLLYMNKIIGVSPHDRETHKPREIPVSIESEHKQMSFEAPNLETSLEVEEKTVSTGETPSQEMLDKLLEEATHVLEQESLEQEFVTKTVDITKMFSEKKNILEVITSPSVRYSFEPKIIAPKNWKLKIVEGEEVYVEDGVPFPAITKIRNLRRLTRKIVETMGLNADTVNICVAKPITDGYNEDKQLFFNATREDSPYRWFGVVARELAYNYSHNHYPHVKAMVDLISIGLANIERILPEFEALKCPKRDSK